MQQNKMLYEKKKSTTFFHYLTKGLFYLSLSVLVATIRKNIHMGMLKENF